MRIPRIYFPGALSPEKTFELDERNAHYISNVLRLKNDMALNLFNGDPGDYHAKIISTGKQTLIEVLSFTRNKRESPLETHLLQSISKGERMDYTIQKAVELGVSTITPIDTARSVAKIKADRLDKRMAHWKNIIISACEQTGRTCIPELQRPLSLNECLASFTNLKSAYIFDTQSKQNFSEALQQDPSSSLTFLVGPEGGLEEEEFLAAEAVGFERAYLGPRVLRTETVASVVLTIAQSIKGDLR